MVDPTSPVFNRSEKIGFIIGKGIRYIIIGGIAIFIRGKLGGSKPYQPVQNPPTPSAPSP